MSCSNVFDIYTSCPISFSREVLNLTTLEGHARILVIKTTVRSDSTQAKLSKVSLGYHSQLKLG